MNDMYVDTYVCVRACVCIYVHGPYPACLAAGGGGGGWGGEISFRHKTSRGRGIHMYIYNVYIWKPLLNNEITSVTLKNITLTFVAKYTFYQIVMCI